MGVTARNGPGPIKAREQRAMLPPNPTKEELHHELDNVNCEGFCSNKPTAAYSVEIGAVSVIRFYCDSCIEREGNSDQVTSIEKLTEK